MVQLKALLCALIVFLPLVVGAKGPEPFSVHVSVDSHYMGATIDEPYVHVTLFHNIVPSTRIFEGHTGDYGYFCAGFYTPLPASIRLQVYRDTPQGPLQRILPLLDPGAFLVHPGGRLSCHATYDWDTKNHYVNCRASK